MSSHIQNKTGAKGLSHKKGATKIHSPKSVESILPVRYMVDRAYVRDFYAWVLGDDYKKELWARKEEERLMDEERQTMW